MASELHPSKRWLSYFTDREHACEWCGATPTLEVTITPAVVKNLRVIRAPQRVWICWRDCRRLQLHPMTNPSAADKIAWQKYVLAERRREQRQADKLGQGQLFDTRTGPSNAITEG